MAPIHRRVAGDPLGGALVVTVVVTGGFVLGRLLVGGDVDPLIGASIAVASFVVAYAIRTAAAQN